MKIMVGYDGSKVSKEALQVAKTHAKAFNAKVHVVHSMMSGTSGNQREVEAAEKDLKWVENFFREADIPCETHLLIRGLYPGEDLVKFAQKNGIDEVFVGVKRRSRVGKILLGSTAQYVIINAPCAVVSIK